jgi:uncharacterized protein YdeI (YjbR/CyaY-like superfamily)
MDPSFFATKSELRKWFDKNHNHAKELWVGYYKTSTGKQSITWPESVDEALCYGWIDGVRKSIDGMSYKIRFTPRKTKSIWSAVNILKAEELIKKGLMKPAGLAVYEKREESRSRIYSFEQENIVLDKLSDKVFKSHKTAWKFFQSQPSSYRRAALWWVISSRQDITRQKRLNTLISDSESGRRLKHLTRPVPKK